MVATHPHFRCEEERFEYRGYDVQKNKVGKYNAFALGGKVWIFNSDTPAQARREIDILEGLAHDEFSIAGRCVRCESKPRPDQAYRDRFGHLRDERGYLLDPSCMVVR